LADDPSLAIFHPDYYRQIALEAIKRVNPSIILAAATSTGKDLAPRLAIHLDTAVASECTHLEMENGKLIATRPAYAGKVLLRVKVNSSPSIATLRPNWPDRAHCFSDSVHCRGHFRRDSAPRRNDQL